MYSIIEFYVLISQLWKLIPGIRLIFLSWNIRYSNLLNFSNFLTWMRHYCSISEREQPINFHKLIYRAVVINLAVNEKKKSIPHIVSLVDF